MNWSVYQTAIFDWVEKAIGNLIVIAVAGAGKTTTLVEMVKRMEGSCLLLAFNRKMGEELKQRVAGLEFKTAGTFHSAGFRAYNGFMRGVRVQVDDKKVAKLFDQYVNDSNNNDFRKYYGFVTKAVGMAKMRGIGLATAGTPNIADAQPWLDMVYHFGIDNELPEDASLNTGISIAQDVLLKSNNLKNVIDFDDMIYLPLYHQVKFYQHDWVLVDEAQDTNPVRRLLARKLLKSNGRLVAVGDPHQAIYGFAGADNNALDKIKEEFDCETLPLTITYRCPKAIVSHAKNWVSHIEAADTAPDGELRTINFDALLDQGLTKTDAILCRYNKYLVNLCFKLIRKGIAARIEGREIGEGLIRLTKKWKVKDLDSLKDRLETYRANEIKKALEKKQEDRADRVSDQVDTLFVLIARAEEKTLDLKGLENMIREMFEDNVKGKGILTLSSCHKAKGLEWDRVFILGRSELMPSQYARQDWQKQQETNLIYVAVTRSKRTLVEVTSVKQNGKEKQL